MGYIAFRVPDGVVLRLEGFITATLLKSTDPSFHASVTVQHPNHNRNRCNSLKIKARTRGCKTYGEVRKYIADFMCKELLLIVECDGITHHDEEAMRRDQRRQKELEEHGFTVIRFADAEVLHPDFAMSFASTSASLYFQ